MSGLSNLNQRLNYYGGGAQQRLINDKARSLNKALLYSYQAATVQTCKCKEFRCLINPNKLSDDYDNKIISIPYKDINLKRPVGMGKTSEGLVPTDIKCGDVILWKETNTHWLVFLQYIEQDAYFRAQIRKCQQQVEIDGKNYWAYIRGPVETTIPWNSKAGLEWNDINHSLVMYITRDDYTVDKLRRFCKLKIKTQGSNEYHTWQVTAANTYFGDGIIQVNLNEYYDNPIEQAQQKLEQRKQAKKEKPQEWEPVIEGPDSIVAYGSGKYSIGPYYQEGAFWCLTENGKRTKYQNRHQCSIYTTVKKGSVWISYISADDVVIAEKEIIIKPL